MASSEMPVHPVKAARLARTEDRRLVDVAGEAGISTSYLSMIEHGLVPPQSTQERLAAVLKRSEMELWPA